MAQARPGGSLAAAGGKNGIGKKQIGGESRRFSGPRQTNQFLALRLRRLGSSSHFKYYSGIENWPSARCSYKTSNTRASY